MTSFGAPQTTSEEQRFNASLANTFARSSFTPDNPEVRTDAEIAAFEREEANQEEAGFFEKIYLAATEETVIGRALQSKSFEPTGYYASKEDIETYAADLPEEVVSNIVDGGYDLGLFNTSPRAESFEEFIYLTKEARETQQLRERLYGGGVGGFAEGLSLAMLASGVEASLIGWLGSLLTAGAGTATAVSEGAASVAATARSASRAKTALKAAGLSAAIDVPLETIRTRYDKTLTTTDLLVNWVASVGVGGGLGAAFPNMYLSPLQRAARDAQLEADAVRAAKAGDTARAASLRAQKTTTRVVAREIVDQKDPLERVMNMSADEVREEAQKRGIRITTKKVKKQVLRKRKRSNRKLSQIREDLVAAMRKESAELSERGVVAVDRQVDSLWARMSRRGTPEQVAARQRRYAEALGIVGSVLNRGGGALKAAVKKAALQAARRGFVVSGKLGRPKGVKLSFTATVGKEKYKLAGNIERMLWKLANAKGKNATKTKSTISRFLKENGVENPEKLAAEFNEKVRQEISDQAARLSDDVSGVVGPRVQPTEYVADISRMDLQSASRVLPDGTRITGTRGEPFAGSVKPVRFKVDADFLEVDPPKRKGVDADADPDEVVVLGPNGEKIAAGDADDFIGMDADLGADATVPRQGQKMPDDPGRIGGRRLLSRGLEKIFDTFTLGLFNPIIYRFYNSKSLAVRRFASIFMDNPQGGGPASVSAVATANFQRVIGKLQNTLGKAGREAAKQRRVLRDDHLIRLVRSGVKESELDAPEAMAVRGLRDFFKDLLEYGKANGLPMENIPDATDYFVRKWNSTKYRSIVDKLGGGDVGRQKLTGFLGRAIRNKVTPEGQKALTQSKAERVASRIAEYLENPEYKVNKNSSISTVDGLKKQLVEDLKDVDEGALKEIGGVEGLAEDLINLIAKDHSSEMNLSFGRRRIALDELYEETIDGVKVSVDSLLDMDIQSLTRSYAHKLIGAVAVRKGFGAAFGNENMSLADAKAAILRASRDAGDSERSAKLYEKSVDQIYKTMLGIPMYSPTAMKIATISNALAQSTMGMTLGFAQIPEIANVFHRTSYRAALQHFPMLKELRQTFGLALRKSPRERLDANDFSSCLECFTAIGGDSARGDHFIRRMDDINFDEEWLKTAGGKYLDAGRLFATMNPLGVMPMDTMLRRWASRASFQHILNTAYKVGRDGKIKLSKGFWRNARERFAQMGLTESDFERLAKVMTNTDYVRTKRGVFGKYTVLDFDFSKVDDQGIVDKLVSAVRKNTDSMIQRQTYGEMPWWMHTNFGKVIGQFRTFTSVAKSKQLFAGVARGDVAEIANVVTSSYLAILGYEAQTYYRSLSKEDPERYWNERTTDEQLIKNAFARSGYSTILPMFVDGSARLFGFPGLIDPSARTTGQALDPVKGATLYTNFYNAVDVILSIGKYVGQGKELTRDDYKNLQNLLWFSKIPILDQLINKHLISMAPESN